MNFLTKTLALVAIALLCSQSNADISIIDGALGNGDFELNNGAATGAVWYSDTPNWYNASGSEGINFTNDSQMGGSSQGGSRGGMPFSNRVQINDTGYTVASAGQTFCIDYDFGAGGNAANWATNPLPNMETFVFTSTTGVNGNTTVADMTQFGGDNYTIDRANDGQWTTRGSSAIYTTTAGDVGNTFYLGMVFNGANNLFPRIDVVTLKVTDPVVVPEPSSLALLGLMGLGLLRRRR